jgi:predicted RNA binding protein YcfA (HicA-like mRNA interferase family)
MSKRDKLRRKLRNNPKDATLQEVETLLTAFGFRLLRVQGSHRIYEYNDGTIVKKIIFPLHGRKIKSLYVKRAVEIIDTLTGEDVQDEADDDE